MCSERGPVAVIEDTDIKRSKKSNLIQDTLKFMYSLHLLIDELKAPEVIISVVVQYEKKFVKPIMVMP